MTTLSLNTTPAPPSTRKVFGVGIIAAVLLLGLTFALRNAPAMASMPWRAITEVMLTLVLPLVAVAAVSWAINRYVPSASNREAGTPAPFATEMVAAAEEPEGDSTAPAHDPAVKAAIADEAAFYASQPGQAVLEPPADAPLDLTIAEEDPAIAGAKPAIETLSGADPGTPPTSAQVRRQAVSIARHLLQKMQEHPIPRIIRGEEYRLLTARREALSLRLRNTVEGTEWHTADELRQQWQTLWRDTRTTARNHRQA